MQLQFRPAREEDAEEVAALVNAAYRGSGGWTHEAALLEGQRTDAEGLQQLMTQENSRLELTFQGRLVGSVHLHRTDDSCYLGMLAVDPGAQGSGMGRRILEHCEDLARSWGCRQMRLTVIHLRSELLAYYQRRGYRLSGRREPFPYIDPSVGRAKVANMELVELIKAL
jgi:GNAT superfamily N-acetyltransferase